VDFSFLKKNQKKIRSLKTKCLPLPPLFCRAFVCLFATTPKNPPKLYFGIIARQGRIPVTIGPSPPLLLLSWLFCFSTVFSSAPKRAGGTTLTAHNTVTDARAKVHMILCKSNAGGQLRINVATVDGRSLVGARHPEFRRRSWGPFEARGAPAFQQIYIAVAAEVPTWWSRGICDELLNKRGAL
jgi:hypothetical protein